MARSRNIKPGFFLNDELAEIEPLGRLLFAGLWCLADREGRLEDRPRKIKAEILPYDECDVDKLLNDLMCANEKFITRYEVEDKEYIQIYNFNKHQNPHKNEVPSTIPSLDCATRSKNGTCTDKNGTTPADSLNLIPDSLNLIPDSTNRPKTVPVKKTKKSKLEIIKKVFGEKVHLSDDQYQRLIEKYGEQETKQMIEILDNWYLTKGKPPNDSDYHTMIGPGWVLKRFKEDQQKLNTDKPKKESMNDWK